MLDGVVVLRPAVSKAVVELTGEHDLYSKDAMRALLTELVEANDLVVVDLSEAEFIDSSLIHNLASVDQLARNRGSHFRIQLHTAAIVEKALEITGMLDSLECVSDRETALRDPTEGSSDPAVAPAQEPEVQPRTGRFGSSLAAPLPPLTALYSGRLSRLNRSCRAPEPGREPFA